MDYLGVMGQKYGTSKFVVILDAMTDREYNHYSKLLAGNLVYRKHSLDDGIFSTFNATKTDSIRPNSIVKEMRKSDIGKEMLEYLQQENVPVRLYYGVDHEKGVLGVYDSFDDAISIYCDETKTIKETASVVIHEATHRKLMGTMSVFDEEVECYKKPKSYIRKVN